MKISCKRENLARGLAIVGRMVKQRATLPVLSNIMIASDKGRLKLAVTDLESAISIWIGAKIDEEGAITLPARTFMDYVSASSDETIALLCDNSDVLVKSSHNRATVKGISAEEFPIIPQVKEGKPITISSHSLKSAIFSVSLAAALDETRPVLAGVLLRVKLDKIKVVSTDSYRLAEKQIALKKSAEQAFDIIIPSRVANELARILPPDETEVEIKVGENQAQFTFGDIEFLSREIEGSFPDYEQIIPSEMAYECESDKTKFAEAVKMVSVFARDSGNNIKFVASEKSLEIAAASSQIGDAKASLEVVSKGSSLSVAFNSKFILDALAVIAGETVTLGFSGELSPGQISDKEDPSYRYIIMPLRSE